MSLLPPVINRDLQMNFLEKHYLSFVNPKYLAICSGISYAVLVSSRINGLYAKLFCIIIKCLHSIPFEQNYPLFCFSSSLIQDVFKIFFIMLRWSSLVKNRVHISIFQQTNIQFDCLAQFYSQFSSPSFLQIESNHRFLIIHSNH